MKPTQIEVTQTIAKAAGAAVRFDPISKVGSHSPADCLGIWRPPYGWGE